MAFVIDRSLYLSPEVVVEPRRCAPLEVKTDPFSLEALVAWLEKQPGEIEYCYVDHGQCLWGVYVTSNGGKYEYPIYRLRGSCMSSEGREMAHEIVCVAVGQPWTFGDALSRARKLLAEREK